MSKVLVLYYSSYGHIEAMAGAIADGARQAGAQVEVKRVPEFVPDKAARDSHYKVDQAAPVAKVEELAAYDAVTDGSPYGATTISGGDGSRMPTANELVAARYQGRKIAEIANKLHG
jgi:multimeric flavodoxin WrbA